MKTILKILPLLFLGSYWQSLAAADLTTWPSQYTLRPWETAKLTPADVVGPDGIVYPDFTGVGVTGGIPDINNPTVRAGYTVFNVRTYGATGDGVTNDDDAVAVAATAARTHANGVNKSILYFPTGSYLLSVPISFSQSNLVVDGDGPAATIIKLATNITQTANNAALFRFVRDPIYTGYLQVTALAARGSNTATFDKDPATNGYTVGSWARILPTVLGAGVTMSDRFSNPDNHVVYTNASLHTVRTFFAKVVAVNSAARTITFDRTFTHDFFVDEAPQARNHAFLKYSGVQDLTIQTLASTATLDPIRMAGVANSWIKNVTIDKCRDWPLRISGVTRFEVRDCQFLGTWTDINRGGVAYLGWSESATDSIMINCQAQDLRHMAIFQNSNRCVISGSTFTGRSITSPQLHGNFPHENLIETSTFDTVGNNGIDARGLSAYASDGAATLRHGVVGPRNVFYNNQVNSGMGSVSLAGMKEGLIFAYNRILKTHDTEAQPGFYVRDRSFDAVVRGNIFQAISTLPFISLTDPTCTGWSVTDNKIYGSNGFLYEGDSAPALAHNNRFFPDDSIPESGTAPEVISIYDWQKANADTARLVLVIDRRTVSDEGGTTAGVVVRIKSSTNEPLDVSLSTNGKGLSVPASVTIPAGEVSSPFTVTGNNVSGGEKLVTVTAAASGLLSDTEKIAVLDQNVAQPNFGGGKWPEPAAGLPPNWKAGNFGQVTVPGTQSYSADMDTWTLEGGGVANEKYHGTLARSGRRFLYQTVDGDGEIQAQLTSATGAKQVGLMITDDESTLTDFIWVEPTGRLVSSSNSNASPHGRPIIQADGGTQALPVWLRIKRTGFVFTVFHSTVAKPAGEGDWTLLASVDMYRDTLDTSSPDYKSPAVLDQRMHFGMFINSGSPTSAATAEFTGVEITGNVVVTPSHTK